MKRFLKLSVLAVIGTVMIIVIVQSSRPKPVQVETAKALRGPLQVTIDEDGETRAHDRYTVAAPITGRLTRITLREGDRVGPATRVATITPQPLDPREKAEALARIQSAEALHREAQQQVERRSADYDQARRDLERVAGLAADKIISRQSLEHAQTTERVATKELEAARSRAESAGADVEHARAALLSLEQKQVADATTVVVHPPVSGRVLRVLEKSDRIVSAGTPLLVISNPDLIEAVVDVLSTDAVRIKPGAPVLIENWGGAAPLHGRVRLVEPYGFTKVSALGIEEQRVNIIADFTERSDGLGDGYHIDARIVIWQCRDVLKIPVSALFRSGQSWAVFVVENGRARLRLIKVGHTNTAEAEITAGLQVGSEVVLHPPNQLTPGTRVKASRPFR